jgi:hypothetical protein
MLTYFWYKSYSSTIKIYFSLISLNR